MGRPSYDRGYASTQGESANPDLWPAGAWAARLGNTGSTIPEFAGDNPDGVVKGATWSETEIGPVLTYDGLLSHVNIGDVVTSNGATAFTALAMIRPTFAKSQTVGILSKYIGEGNNRSWAITMKADRTIEVALSSNGLYQAANNTVSTTRIPLDEWSVVGFRYNGSQTAVFVDGVIEATNSTAPTSLYSTTSPGQIGHHFYLEGHPSFAQTTFDGDIADSLIYAEALSDDKIRRICADTLAPFIPLRDWSPIGGEVGAWIPTISGDNDAGDLVP